MTVLRERVARHKNQTAAAKSLGISKQLLSHILRGRSGIGPSLLKKLGFKMMPVQMENHR